MSSERRRFTRIPFEIGVNLKLNDRVYTSDSIINLSVGGCVLPLTVENVQPGMSCRIIIPMGIDEEGLKVNVEGEVIRQQEEGIVIKFIGIDPDSLYHLQNIIRYNCPDVSVVEKEMKNHPGIK
jgi:hypothetical protein